MKKQLLKMLYAFIIMMVFSFTAANAQIVYTDVIPDYTLQCSGSSSTPCDSTYNLDLNNDAINDFNLAVHLFNGIGPMNSRASVTPLNGNAVKDTMTTYNVSIPFVANSIIDSNLLAGQSWQTSGLNNMRDTISSGSSGLWNNLSDYYLGLRLLNSGQNYYGWVRLRIDVSWILSSIIIKDYAYNSIPDQLILAGDTGAGPIGIIQNIASSSLNIFPNPAINYFTIVFPSNNKSVQVSITNITGKIIYTITKREIQKIEVNTTDFVEGVYVVQIQTADFIATKKIIVTK